MPSGAGAPKVRISMPMNAVILAAGVGARLGPGGGHPPKALLRFGGKSLLQRHLEILRRHGVTDVSIATGYRADLITAELAAIGAAGEVKTVFNPQYEDGSLVSLWKMRDELTAGNDVLLMDADVLYDGRMMERLLTSMHRNCFLLDRNLEPSEEPVKLCIRDGQIVDFHKKLRIPCDFYGESVGFFRLMPDIAADIVAAAQSYLDAGHNAAMYEEAIRDVVLKRLPGTFAYEDITGLPWVEIDFPEDVRRAEQDILSRLVDQEA